MQLIIIMNLQFHLQRNNNDRIVSLYITRRWNNLDFPEFRISDDHLIRSCRLSSSSAKFFFFFFAAVFYKKVGNRIDNNRFKCCCSGYIDWTSVVALPQFIWPGNASSSYTCFVPYLPSNNNLWQRVFLPC